MSDAPAVERAYRRLPTPALGSGVDGWRQQRVRGLQVAGALSLLKACLARGEVADAARAAELVADCEAWIATGDLPYYVDEEGAGHAWRTLLEEQSTCAE